MNRFYTHRRGILAGLFLLLVADAAAYAGWVRRPAGQPEMDPAELVRLEREVEARATEVARLERVREQAPRLRPRLEAFAVEHLLAERTAYSRLAADLEQAARQAGVQLGQVSYDTREEKSQPDLVRVEITTSVEGSYADLLEYLGALERSERLYLIDELNVAGVRGGRVRLELRLAAYLRRAA